MDSRSWDEGAGTAKEGGFRSSGIFFRADKVDLKSIDFQLETMITKAWGKGKDGGGTQRVKEEWEIDPSKRDITHFITRGTYGMVYRANYQGRDVAD